MNVLDTFYILFKSNAGDVKKANKEAEKSSNELAESLKNASEEAEQLGKNFVKAVEGATQAIAAVVSFGAIKAGVLNAAKFNSDLEVQGRLMGQNVRDIKAYGAAVEAAGGSARNFGESLKSAFTNASNAGLPLPPVDVLMRRYREAIRGLTPSGAAFRLGQLGVTDPGMMTLLQQSDEEFEKSIAAAREHAKVTEEDTHAAREFEAAWSKLGQTFDALFTQIGSDVLPVFTKLFTVLTDFATELRDNKGEMYAFFGGMIALSITAAGAVGKLAASLLALGSGGALGALAAVAKNLGVFGFVTAGIPLIANASYAGGQAIGRWIKGESAPSAASATGDASDTKAAMDFWMSQGYTRAQAAGIVANERHESGHDASAIGDGGRARGLYQWHPDRAARIQAGTGIDVRTASAADQRRAAAWELKEMGLDAQLRQIDDPDQAASFFSRKFERPKYGDYEALARGKTALSIAGSSPFTSLDSSISNSSSSRSVSVKIDEVNVVTQATDANGIAAGIGQDLNSQLRSTMSNFDDGIAY